MTIEEIKRSTSMREVVERYGFSPNRSGFIRCPFHKGDRTASLKIYKDSFHCFGCGADGDVFDFIRLMDDVSFKDAYISLGGEYEHFDRKDEEMARKQAALLAKAIMEQQKGSEEQETLSLEQQVCEHTDKIRETKREIKRIAADIDDLRSFASVYPPMSDDWCECMRALEKALIKYDCLREEVEE